MEVRIMTISLLKETKDSKDATRSWMRVATFPLPVNAPAPSAA